MDIGLFLIERLQNLASLVNRIIYWPGSDDGVIFHNRRFLTAGIDLQNFTANHADRNNLGESIRPNQRMQFAVHA